MEKTENDVLIVVSDAGPLIHLDELGCLDLLGDFHEILVPHVVNREVQKHRPSAFDNNHVKIRFISATNPESAQLEGLSRILSLHIGEREALKLLLEYGSGLLLTDDTAARLAAQNLQIKAHGTIGILVRSIRRNQKSVKDVIKLLRAIPQVSTLHIKRSLLDEIIQDVEKAI